MSVPTTASGQIDWSHPLARGLEAWYLAVPQFIGSNKWFSLTKRNHGNVNNMELPDDWYPPYPRPGGWAGANFGGTNEYIECGQLAGVLDGVTQFTLSGWFRRNASSDICGGGKYLDNNNRVHILFYSDGTLYGGIANGASTSGFVAHNTTNWAHVVMAYDGGGSGNTGRLQLYVDGALQTLSFAGTIPATTSAGMTTSFLIGRVWVSSALYSIGQIDDVQVRSRWLSAEEARWLYRESITGYPKMLWRPKKVFGFVSGAPPATSSIHLINNGLTTSKLVHGGLIGY